MRFSALSTEQAKEATMTEVSRETNEIICEDQISEEDRQTLWEALVRYVVQNRKIDLPCYGTPAVERA